MSLFEETIAGQRRELNDRLSAIEAVGQRVSELGADASIRWGTIDGRLESLEAGLIEQVRQMGRVLSLLGENAEALSRVRAAHEDRNGDLAALLERADANLAQSQRLRELIATLPEVAGATAESLAGMDQRLDELNGRWPATEARLDRLEQALAGLREALGPIEQSLAATRQSDAERAASLHQLGAAFKTLVARVTELVQFVKAQQKAAGELREEAGRRHAEILDRITEQSRASAGPARLAMVFAILAALAAIAAAILPRVLP